MVQVTESSQSVAEDQFYFQTETGRRDEDGRNGDSEHTLQAWSTVAGSFLVYFATLGYINSFGFFQNYYEQNDLSNDPSAIIALIGSLQIGLMYIVGPLTGVLFDSYGHKVRCLFYMNANY